MRRPCRLDIAPRGLENGPAAVRARAAGDRYTKILTASRVMTHLLLVDDDPGLLLDQVEHVFARDGVEITVAGTGAEGLRQFEVLRPDVVLLDIRLPDLSGLDVYRQIQKIDARTPVVFITATTTAETAIEAVRQGAFDYLFKPVGLEQLTRVVGQAFELGRLMRVPTVMTETVPDEVVGDAIIGRCPAMREVYKAIGRVADQTVIVLITGESGTGKELVARAIYQHGSRSKSPFLAINCAAIPESLLESELFGHEKGAFTGADRRRIGKFEQCNGGTIFLDEIGDMPLATQGKMLRLLQDQTFERVGGNETIQNRRPGDRRDESGFAGDVQRRQISPRSVLSAERVRDSIAASARTRRRPLDARQSLHPQLRSRSRPRRAGNRPGSGGAFSVVFLAGQYSRAAKRA